jgi:hypothetical protein
MKKENENQRNMKPCVRQSIEKQKRKKQTQKHNQQERKRHRETDTLRADAGKSEKHRRTKVKQQPALGQATKTPFQPEELECDHGHISCCS